MDKKHKAYLNEIIDYLYLSEKKHWEEAGEPEDHIFKAVEALAKWLEDPNYDRKGTV